MSPSLLNELSLTKRELLFLSCLLAWELLMLLEDIYLLLDPWRRWKFILLDKQYPK